MSARRFPWPALAPCIDDVPVRQDIGIPAIQAALCLARTPDDAEAHPLPDDDINPNNLVIPVVLASNLVFWLLLVLAAFWIPQRRPAVW